MGVPREPVRLVNSARHAAHDRASHRASTHTDAMREFAARRVEALARWTLRGYMLKSESPSCGSQRREGLRRRCRAGPTGTGLFAAALTSAFPDLPIEEERRLADPAARASFLERVIAYDRRTISVRHRSRAQAASAPAESLTPTRSVPVSRVSGVKATRATDMAAAEEPLDIRLHGRSFAVIMRTPGEDRALAAGFLLSERIIRSADDIGAIEHCRHPDQTQGPPRRRRLPARGRGGRACPGCSKRGAR